MRRERSVILERVDSEWVERKRKGRSEWRERVSEREREREWRKKGEECE